MIKVYEAIRQNNARLVTNYCGVGVTLNFVDGNIYAGKNAQLRTNNRFIQDAIEHDPRFNVNIRLKSAIPEPEDEMEKIQEEDESPKDDEKPKKQTKGKSAKAASKTATEAVESVKTLNDAMDFFAEKGELLESAEEINKLCDKYGVSFPNLK